MTEFGTISDLGEFGLIDRISSLVGDVEVVVGIGDDTAVIDVAGDSYLLATVDMLVENVHFILRPRFAYQIGMRSIAVNVSDIAAMGGTPTWALTSLAVPPSLPTDVFDDLYRGIAAASRDWGVIVVGGNITRTDGPLTIDITLLGTVHKGDLVLRRGARPGDVLAVTGSLGLRTVERLVTDAAERRGEEVPAELYPVPTPRLEAGRKLAELHLARAMMDISDGLGGDVFHLARASGVGVILQESWLPILSETRAGAESLSIDPIETALYGGDDYELLIVIPEDRIDDAREALLDVPLTVVGRIVAGDTMSLQSEDGSVRALQPKGWSHF